MQEVTHRAAQRLDKLLRAGKRKADHVDHGVRLERGDLRAKAALRFGGDAVDHDLLHLLPRAVRLIGRTRLAADIDHFVAGFDQVRHKIGAHVPAAADDDNSHDLLS